MDLRATVLPAGGSFPNNTIAGVVKKVWTYAESRQPHFWCGSVTHTADGGALPRMRDFTALNRACAEAIRS